MQEQATKKGISRSLSVFRTIGTWFLWFAVSLGVLIFLSWLSACIPRSAIRENVLKSAEYLLTSEDVFYQMREGDRRTEIHNYADATTLNIMYSIDGEDRFKEIFISPFYTDRVNEKKTVIELLKERVEQEEEADTVYDRYWHGMTMLLRPLFLLCSIQGIRYVFLAVLIALFVFLEVLLVRRKQETAAVLLVFSATMVQLPITAFCMEYVPVILIMLGVSIAMVYSCESRKKIWGLCVISGVCVAFFDFLTTETLAIVVPLSIVYCIWAKEGKLQMLWKEIKFLVGAGISWGAAYIGSYFVKWTFSGIVLGENRWSTAVESFLARQGDSVISFALDSLIGGELLPVGAEEMAGGEVLPQWLSAVVINLRLLLGLSGKITLESLALILLFVAAGIVGVIFLYRKKEAGALPVILFLLGMVPVARMMLLHNHSVVHCFFVYRAFLGTLFCFMAGFIEVIDWRILQRRNRRK